MPPEQRGILFIIIRSQQAAARFSCATASVPVICLRPFVLRLCEPLALATGLEVVVVGCLWFVQMFVC